MRLLFSVLICAICLTAEAAPPKPPICVDAGGEDKVGQVVVYRLKSEIRNAGVFSLVDSCDDATYMLAIKTVDPENPPDNGQATVYSAVFNVKSATKGLFYFGASTTGLCGQKVVTQCVVGIASFADDNLAMLREVWKNSQSKAK